MTGAGERACAGRRAHLISIPAPCESCLPKAAGSGPTSSNTAPLSHPLTAKQKIKGRLLTRVDKTDPPWHSERETTKLRVNRLVVEKGRAGAKHVAMAFVYVIRVVSITIGFTLWCVSRFAKALGVRSAESSSTPVTFNTLNIPCKSSRRRLQ